MRLGGRSARCSKGWSHVAMQLAVGGLFGVAFAPASAAISLGTFELRASALRAPQAEELIDLAVSDARVQQIHVEVAAAEAVVTGGSDSEHSQDAVSTVGNSGAAPGTSSATQRSGATGRQPEVDRGEPRSAASQDKLRIPNPGEQASRGYYDTRAEAVLKAERRRLHGEDDSGLEPGITAVVCFAGCQNDVIAIVYHASARTGQLADTGELSTSANEPSAQAPAAEAGATNVISCVAGCYEESAKTYAVRDAGQIHDELRHALERANGSAGAAAEQDIDGLTTHQKQQSGASGKPHADARPANPRTSLHQDKKPDPTHGEWTTTTTQNTAFGENEYGKQLARGL